jgi:hypothetical protein
MTLRFAIIAISCLLSLPACGAHLLAQPAGAQPPLHQQIDAIVGKRLAELKIIPAELSSDAEFIRRAYLDLTGVIPTAKQARAFLDDKDPDKRARLIDELLAGPEYPLHMARVFDVMLAERRIPVIGSYDVPAGAWQAYLTSSFAENKPWDQMVREILASDGSDERLAGAAKFYLARDAAPHQLTRDIGRLFIGVDLQCAQCHDDPRFADYLQADYYGIYAFVQRLKVHPLSPRGALVAEAADGKATYTSVFTAKGGTTHPRLPGGEMIADPELEKGKEYLVKPGPKDRGMPTYSRRAKLAEQLPRPETRNFSRNIANRMWAMLMGRGIVHPLDLHHATNPPSHPELLVRLEGWLVAHKYDIRGFLREIALSQTYQRSSDLPKGVKQVPADAFAVAPLRGLSAEQLRWSLLQATGRIEMHFARPSPKPKEPESPAWKTRLERYAPLERQSTPLAAAFAGLPGQPEGEFQPVVDQALFLKNSPKLLPLLQDEPGTLLAKLAATREAEPLVEELYLSVLARRPTTEETAEVKKLLDSAKTPAERKELLQAALWGLLLSAEFRLNH